MVAEQQIDSKATALERDLEETCGDGESDRSRLVIFLFTLHIQHKGRARLSLKWIDGYWPGTRLNSFYGMLCHG